MNTSHHRDGPDSIVLSGPLPGIPFSELGHGGCTAFFANDNIASPALLRPEHARAILLCPEQDAAERPVIAIRILMADGGTTLLETTENAQDVIALWRAAGESMNLPLALRGADGVIRFCTLAPGEISYARRGGSPLSGRRPRVMRRRQPPLKAFVFKQKTKKA